jgi:hypothetical protein
MAAREADHIGNQPVLIMQRQIGFLIDRGMAVPAEGFKRFLHKLARLRLSKAPSDSYSSINARQRGVKMFRLDRISAARSRSDVFNQLQTQQRGKDTKRITDSAASSIGETPLSGRAPRLREVVIADREHPHNGKHTAQGGKLKRACRRGSHRGAQRSARQFIGVRQLFM